MNFPPDKLSLSGAASLFHLDRHRLGALRETDDRFPGADERGRFSPVQLSAFLELRRIESLTDSEIATEGRESREAVLALDFLSPSARKRLLACPLPTRAERIKDCLTTLSAGTLPTGEQGDDNE